MTAYMITRPVRNSFLLIAAGAALRAAPSGSTVRLDGHLLDPRLPRRLLRKAESAAQVAAPTEGERALDRADARIAAGGTRLAAFAAEALPTFSRWARVMRDNAVTDAADSACDIATYNASITSYHIRVSIFSTNADAALRSIIPPGVSMFCTSAIFIECGA